MAAPVITSPTPGKFGWIINATCSDASACEELKAAIPGASIIIDHVTLNNGSAGTQDITIGQGESGPGSVETALIGPCSMDVNSSLQWNFPQGMVLTAGKSLTVDSGDTHNLMIFAYGRVE
jgi:hypothetical protein